MKKLLVLVFSILISFNSNVWSADYNKGWEAYKSGEYATALREFKPLANNGDAASQHKLSLMYFNGLGVSQDYKTGHKWLKLSVEQDYAGAQNTLGYMYFNGLGVSKDVKNALKWFRLSAKQGNKGGQSHLGLMYSFGQGVPQNFQISIKWLRLAADQGDTNAQFSLGAAYYHGERGVPQNYMTAVKWYKLAAATKGNTASVAQSNLGEMYYNGHDGVPQNYKTAVKWWRLAAEEDYVDAQHGLGVAYINGNGVSKNEEVALKWFTLAAEQGNSQSQSMKEHLLERKRVADAKKTEEKKKAAERKRVADAKKAAERKSSFPYKARITCSDDMWTCAPFTDTFIELTINNRTQIYDTDDLFNKYRLPGCGDPVCVIDLPESFALTVYRHGLGIPGLGKITVRILDNNNNILFEDQTASDYGVISVYSN